MPTVVGKIYTLTSKKNYANLQTVIYFHKKKKGN